MIVRLFLFCLVLLVAPAAGQPASTAPPSSQPRPDSAAPAVILSGVEEQFSQLAGQTLRLVAHASLNSDLPPVEGGITNQPDQILQAGDAVTVALRGRTNRTETIRIDSQGTLLLSDLPPIAAAGLTLAQTQELVRQAVAARAVATEAYLSLAAARPLRVTVLGAVARPGGVSLPSGADVLDALRAAGGVRAEGSLRSIRIDPGSKAFDLQSILLIGDGPRPPVLTDGAVVRVPPLGPLVAVSGGVVRPGLLELPPNGTLTVAAALALAGGPVVPGIPQLILSRARKGGGRHAIAARATDLLQAGDLLSVEMATDRLTGTVMLEGAVYRPGPRPRSGTGLTLASLLANGDVLTPAAYPLFGLIYRHDGQKLAQDTLVFSPRDILLGRQKDIPLLDGDRVELPDRESLLVLAQESLLPPGNQAAWPGLSLLRDHVVQVNGAVRQPGAYPLAGTATLSDMLAMAGGLTRMADQSAVELTQAEDTATQTNREIIVLKDGRSTHTIHPGALILVPERAPDVVAQAVRIEGEVVRPGSYDLHHGERLSSLLVRAGGLTTIAYAPGALLRRQSVQLAELQAMKSAADALDQSLAGALVSQRSLAPHAAETARSLVERLRSTPALGRVVIEADPARLAEMPELDILLEPGDTIIYPKRPSTVLVTGEVLAGGALQFRTGQQARDYIAQAGGTTEFADDDRAFVLLPDGRARRLHQSVWEYSAVPIVPGSTIIVPQDPTPFRPLEVAVPITSILSQLAVTAASLTIIGRE